MLRSAAARRARRPAPAPRFGAARTRAARVRAARARRRVADEDGSTLVLYPFAVLIVLALGGLALDAAVFFQAHRETVDVAAGLAGDIAGVVDEAAFAREDGAIRIDVDRAGALVGLTNADLRTHPYELRCRAAIRPAAPATVEVECTGRAQAILLPAAGVLGDLTLRGSATASAGAR